MKRNAIIIAAGTSSRFVPLSFEKPKGLIEVKGEVLIERQLRHLHEAGIDDITIAVGYMAEKFAYLADKYGVKFVQNEDYSRDNNTSSMIRVLDRLSNTYICCSDQYYEKNPFLQDLHESAYAALFAKGETKEYCLDLDDIGQIQNVHIGGSDDWYMAGYAYFNKDFSNAFSKILKEEYQYEKMRQMYWEDVYIKHLHNLPLMHVIKFADGDVVEFDSLDELREFDTSYVENTRSSLLKYICYQMHCNQRDLKSFKKVNEQLGMAFQFQFNADNYLFKNGEITRC